MRGFKFLLLSFLVLVSSKESFGTVRINAVYSEAANTFDILDNVSNWWEGFCEIEYQKYWELKFGLSDQDKKLFDDYRKIRERYYSDSDQKEKEPLKNRNGLFATVGSINADPFAEIFYDSSTLDEAYSRLNKLVSADETRFIKGFHAHFLPKLSEFLKESESFKKIVPRMDKNLNESKISGYFGEIAHFFKVQPNLNYKVLLVWWPPLDRTNASPTNRFLVMRYNPIIHIALASEDSEIVYHEIVHTISAQQSLDQKQRLTKSFLEKCDSSKRVGRGKILEEPLAVTLGQLEFTKRFRPKKFSLTESAYNDPWVDGFSKRIYPLVAKSLRENKTIDSGFIDEVAAVCREFIKSSK